MKEQNIEMNMVQFQSVQHKGSWYHNTSIGPAVAEEFVCVDILDILLKVKDNKFLSENEAIFEDILVTN